MEKEREKAEKEREKEEKRAIREAEKAERDAKKQIKVHCLLASSSNLLILLLISGYVTNRTMRLRRRKPRKRATMRRSSPLKPRRRMLVPHISLSSEGAERDRCLTAQATGKQAAALMGFFKKAPSASPAPADRRSGQ